jgi:O-antigen/teichoic acid export membrane protein
MQSTTPTPDTVAPAATAHLVRTPHRTLASDASWLLGAQLAYAACQWATLVALAKLAAPSAIGYIGLALAVTNPIVLLTGFGMRAYESTDVLRRFAFADYLNLRHAGNVVAGVAVGLILGLGVVQGEAAAVLLPIAVAKLAEATSETCYGLAQRHGRIRFVAVSKSARGMLGLGAFVAVVASGGTVAEGAWGLAVAWMVFLFAMDLPAAAALEPAVAWPRRAMLRELAADSAPLGAVAGLVALIQSAPRVLLEHHAGVAVLGYYTALSAVSPAIGQLAAAMGNAAAPRLGWAVATDAAGYRRLVRRLLAAATLATVLLGLGTAAFGPAFLRAAYAPDYAAYGGTFVLVAVAAGLGMVVTIGSFALIAERRNRLLLGIYALGLVVTSAVAASTVPPWGIDGAAAGAMVGALVMALATGWTLLARRARG